MYADLKTPSAAAAAWTAASATATATSAASPPIRAGDSKRRTRSRSASPAPPAPASASGSGRPASSGDRSRRRSRSRSRSRSPCRTSFASSSTGFYVMPPTSHANGINVCCVCAMPWTSGNSVLSIPGEPTCRCYAHRDERHRGVKAVFVPLDVNATSNTALAAALNMCTPPPPTRSALRATFTRSQDKRARTFRLALARLDDLISKSASDGKLSCDMFPAQYVALDQIDDFESLVRHRLGDGKLKMHVGVGPLGAVNWCIYGWADYHSHVNRGSAFASASSSSSSSDDEKEAEEEREVCEQCERHFVSDEWECPAGETDCNRCWGCCTHRCDAVGCYAAKAKGRDRCEGCSDNRR